MAGSVATIEVSEGPGAGQKLRLAVGESAVIGRGSEAQLNVPDPAVSRRHVLLEHRPEGVLVRDLGSKHGATLDARPIPQDGVVVALSATLLLGSSRIRIRRQGRAKGPDLPGIRIDEKLGEGEVGEVFSGWQDPPGRRVAVKALARGADAVARKRLAREAALEGRLAHPAILQVFELIEGKERLYLVRELVDGVSLDAELARGPLPWNRVVAIGATIADALAHAHGRGIVHRDVKPGNILLERPGGNARLADFDLARDAAFRATLADATRLTETGQGLGTFSYVAPEQVFDARHASAKADVYGLAASLYHALSGERPFAGVPGDLFLQALYAGPKPLDEVAPAVPAPVRAVVTGALAIEPERRPDARALAASLRALGGP